MPLRIRLPGVWKGKDNINSWKLPVCCLGEHFLRVEEEEEDGDAEPDGPEVTLLKVERVPSISSYPMAWYGMIGYGMLWYNSMVSYCTVR